MTEQSIGEQLAGWGKVALLETRGRTSGQLTRTAVGFIEEPDGALVVAAGADRADWVRNVLAEPHCRATVGDRTATYLAEPLADGPARSSALAALILKYGTPAEGLGHGPVFRLRPIG